jgi:hypothetical protein
MPLSVMCVTMVAPPPGGLLRSWNACRACEKKDKIGID